MDKTMMLLPRVSEKAYGLSTAKNVYIFDVPRSGNKTTIAKAVEAQFGVTVVVVNTSNLKGKAKRTVRKGGKAIPGRDVDVKKAYVTVKEGQTIPIFPKEDDKKQGAKK
jgi:large subunit ribosomal protein L23